ncbi:MAG: hypothetical protein HLUCCA11_08410 [Phormidesmis priestleyi Ana]|uniref:Uncharacterized protein n=1 Tax=Phormidesmis priestleyi Ana TaxID=1666911 RepID=A0A0P7YXD5_9CYAN|nr:MAG: hypothetical protein HLUCCA11_08410 [Phormidesmis priestleyi Ana]
MKPLLVGLLAILHLLAISNGADGSRTRVRSK